jgi:GT2 family glycosyltransferase
VTGLVEALEEDRELGAAGALIVNPGEEDRTVHYFTATLDRDAALHRNLFGLTPVAGREWGTERTPFVPACALMYRAQALREVGLFDERLFVNWEDYDLCVRFGNAGWGIAATGRAEVVHLWGVTTGRASPYITYYAVRNRLICLFRYASPGRMLLRSPYILRTFYWTVKRYGMTNWPCHRAFFLGVLHAAIGVRGKGRPPVVRSG